MAGQLQCTAGFAAACKELAEEESYEEEQLRRLLEAAACAPLDFQADMLLSLSAVLLQHQLADLPKMLTHLAAKPTFREALEALLLVLSSQGSAGKALVSDLAATAVQRLTQPAGSDTNKKPESQTDGCGAFLELLGRACPSALMPHLLQLAELCSAVARGDSSFTMPGDGNAGDLLLQLCPTIRKLLTKGREEASLQSLAEEEVQTALGSLRTAISSLLEVETRPAFTVLLELKRLWLAREAMLLLQTADRVLSLSEHVVAQCGSSMLGELQVTLTNGLEDVQQQALAAHQAWVLCAKFEGSVEDEDICILAGLLSKLCLDGPLTLRPALAHCLCFLLRKKPGLLESEPKLLEAFREGLCGDRRDFRARSCEAIAWLFESCSLEDGLGDVSQLALLQPELLGCLRRADTPMIARNLLLALRALGRLGLLHSSSAFPGLLATSLAGFPANSAAAYQVLLELIHREPRLLPGRLGPGIAEAAVLLERKQLSSDIVDLLGPEAHWRFESLWVAYSELLGASSAHAAEAKQPASFEDLFWRRHTPKIEPHRCRARIWQLGLGDQCRRQACNADADNGSTFCEKHRSTWKEFGRVDGPIPEERRQQFQEAAGLRLAFLAEAIAQLSNMAASEGASPSRRSHTAALLTGLLGSLPLASERERLFLADLAAETLCEPAATFGDYLAQACLQVICKRHSIQVQGLGSSDEKKLMAILTEEFSTSAAKLGLGSARWAHIRTALQGTETAQAPKTAATLELASEAEAEELSEAESNHEPMQAAVADVPSEASMVQAPCEAYLSSEAKSDEHAEEESDGGLEEGLVQEETPQALAVELVGESEAAWQPATHADKDGKKEAQKLECPSQEAKPRRGKAFPRNFGKRCPGCLSRGAPWCLRRPGRLACDAPAPLPVQLAEERQPPASAAAQASVLEQLGQESLGQLLALSRLMPAIPVSGPQSAMSEFKALAEKVDNAVKKLQQLEQRALFREESSPDRKRQRTEATPFCSHLGGS